MADEYDPLSLFLQDAPGVTPIPRVNTSPDRRPWLQRTGDRAVQRIVETAKAEAARKRDPLNALLDALGILPGGQPVALAADMAAQGKHPWKRDVGREIDQFAEGVGEAIRNPADALEVAASEAPADWLGVGMRGHTRGEKPGGDLLMQLGAALGIANATPTPKPRPRIDMPRRPAKTTTTMPVYANKPGPRSPTATGLPEPRAADFDAYRVHRGGEPVETVLDHRRKDGWVANDESFDMQPEGVSASESLDDLSKYARHYSMNVGPDDRLVGIRGLTTYTDRDEYALRAFADTVEDLGPAAEWRAAYAVDIDDFISDVEELGLSEALSYALGGADTPGARSWLSRRLADAGVALPGEVRR